MDTGYNRFCYDRVSDASTNPENMKKNNPLIFFGKPFSASLWKNELLRFRSSLNMHVSTHGAAIVFSQAAKVYQF